MARENLVYLLTGPEEFLKEEEIRRIKSKLFNDKDAVFNYNVFYAKEADAQTILEVAKSLPFISSHRLLVVRDVDKLSPSNKELLLSYIRNPNSQTVLVLETSQENEAYFSNLVLKYGKVIHFKKLRDDEVGHWVERRVNANRKRIETKAIEAIVQNVGDDLRNLANAIDTLILYLGDRDLILEEDVQTLIGISSVSSIFELVDAIGQKDTQGALRVLSSLFNSGEKPPQILGLIAWHWRRLWQAKQFLSRGETKYGVGDKLGIRGYFLDKVFRQLSNFQLAELKEGFNYLLEIDVDIKMGRLDPRLCLEMLVVRLCQQHDKIFS